MEYTNIYPPRRCGLGQGFLGVSYYNNKQLLGWIGKVACEAEEGCKRADQLGFVESFVEKRKNRNYSMPREGISLASSMTSPFLVSVFR